MQGPYARLLRTILTALLMLAAVVGTAVGDTFDDALAAYQKGDYAIALQLFRALADDGREDAQYNLGFMYFSGKGVAQDYAEAANWYRLAADQGFARSQYALGSMYFNGWGVRQDYILAFMWFDLSAAHGHQAAVSARDNVAKQMTPAQIAEAQNRAGGWRPTLHRETVDVGIYPWSSIGKVGVTSVTLGKGCSGAVIGANEFLTAAHCLYNKTTKRFFPAGSIHLLLGYSRGEYRAHRVASRYTISPAVDPSNYSYPPTPEKLGMGARHDWAIVYVDEPFPADVKPLRLATSTPSPGTAVKVVGYPVERLHTMTADQHCRVVEISSDKKLIKHDCVTHPADSGSPLLSKDDEGLILGVISVGLHVDPREPSKKGGAAVSAASISEFIATPAH
jgi:V8-like Glu-specific endopeptidase